MRVLVVGGGSAGWITAAYLNASLNTPQQQNAQIALIESEAVGRIGVGEATIPTIKRTLARIGMREVDFMKATDATFKQAIRFNDWVEKGHNRHRRWRPGNRGRRRSSVPILLRRTSSGG